MRLKNNNKIKHLAARIYSQETAEKICHAIREIVAQYQFSQQRTDFSEKDAILITYADMVTKPGEKPLTTLHQFLKYHAAQTINAVHILPFFPYSSDEGFSVIDYKTVDPSLGNWDDIQALSQDFSLMFDLVANHTSVESAWFKGFIHGEEQYREYYITIPPESDIRSVFRPRTSPLLSPFDAVDGRKYVWTTFSADQVDLNYKEPKVLVEMIDILMFYASQSARYIRLDAIAYIWKELGTACIHLPPVHLIIQIMRLVLDLASPGVKLVTETNVPHKDNISYFGNGKDEAQLVYNFSLPPLTLHAFHSGNSEVFTRWAATLKTPSDSTAFFNFLASHDGIGITPAHGLLPDDEIAAMAKCVDATGGFVSYKTNANGTESAYEFNINYFDALNNPFGKGLPLELKVRRFVSAHAIMAALQGIPGIYFHSLFGSTSWFAGAKESGMARTINRERLGFEQMEVELADESSLRSSIYTALRRLLATRSQHRAFHPNAPQMVPMINPSIITIIRRDPGKDEAILCLHNICAQETQVALGAIPNLPQSAGTATRVIYHNAGRKHDLRNGEIILLPFESVWVKITA